MGNEAGAPLTFVVAVALIGERNEILLQKRPEGKSMAGLWEFPGGKVEPGETPERALVRELQEELALEVAEADLLPACFASEPIGERHLVLLLYTCRRWIGDPAPHHADELRWVSLDAMDALPMPPADRPLIGLLASIIARAPSL